MRAVTAQALRSEARLVAELVDHLLHAVDGRLGDAVPPIDDFRHGRDRHARGAGDVDHLHALHGLHDGIIEGFGRGASILANVIDSGCDRFANVIDND